jgi:hypothetical protein
LQDEQTRKDIISFFERESREVWRKNSGVEDGGGDGRGDGGEGKICNLREFGRDIRYVEDFACSLHNISERKKAEEGEKSFVMWREESSYFFHTHFIGMEMYVQIPITSKELKEGEAEKLRNIQQIRQNRV